MAVEGYEAFDISVNETVLVMSVVLCFLGDSPMHSEITNTPIPGTSLNPCRMCDLWAASKNDKKTIGYLEKYLNIDSNGREVCYVAALCMNFRIAMNFFCFLGYFSIPTPSDSGIKYKKTQQSFGK